MRNNVDYRREDPPPWPLPLRRSKRLSSSSSTTSRVPSEVRFRLSTGNDHSPTPVNRQLTPGRPRHNLNTLDVVSDDDDEDRMSSNARMNPLSSSSASPQPPNAYPSVIMFRRNFYVKPFLRKLSFKLETWKYPLLFLVFVFLLFLTQLRWPDGHSALDNIRFFVLVAPECLLGLLTNFFGSFTPSTKTEYDLDLIVTKVISDPKFQQQLVLSRERQTEKFEESRQTQEKEQRLLLLLFQDDLKRKMNEDSTSFRSQLEDIQYVIRSNLENRITSLERKLSKLEKDVSFHSFQDPIQSCKDIVSKYVRDTIYNESSDLNLHLQNRYVLRTSSSSSPSSSSSSSTTTTTTTSLSLVRKIVQEALNKYDADKTGRFDFALESAGGTIMSTRCTETYDTANAVYSVWGIPFWWERNTPRSILQPGSSPGQCWAFRGSQGSAVIGLSGYVRIRAFTMEHISRTLTPRGEITSAPKRFSVYGLRSMDENEDSFPLGNFTYLDTGDPVQTFTVDVDAPPFHLVELKILSNYGHMTYTCLYRFRVHGIQSKRDRG